MAKSMGSIKITVLAKDQPGELIRILKPLSENGANIQGVFHDHSFPDSQPGEVPVEVSFQLDPTLGEEDKKQKLDKIKSALIADGEEILDISMENIVQKMHVILIGFIFETDIHDSIVQLSSTGAKVQDLKASFASLASESTVMVTLTYDSDDIEPLILQKVAEISEQKDLKFITS